MLIYSWSLARVTQIAFIVFHSLLGENCSVCTLSFLIVAVVGCVGGGTRRFAAELWQLEQVGFSLTSWEEKLKLCYRSL